MTLLALAIACLAITTLSYGLLCAVSPFGRCRKCHGIGTLPPTGRLRRRPKPCPRCRATGRRLRIGRRLHNHSLNAAEHARRVREDAHH